MTPRTSAVADAPVAVMTGVCVACRTLQPSAALEPVPTRPFLARCKDEDACRSRYTPRRLARSTTLKVTT